MDIDLIRTFIQVAKTSHFRRAAEQLFLTPSAVSARIKLLEERIGVQLLNRSKHEVSLTAAGSRFLARAEKMVELWAHASQEAQLSDPAESAIVIGATDTLWNIFLTDWVIEMRQTNPSLEIWAELHTAASLIPGLLDGSIDIAVMFDVTALPRVMVQELSVVELIMVASRKNIPAAEALREDYIAVDWGDAFLTALKHHFGPDIGATIHTSVGKVAYELLLKAGGAAYLPAAMVTDALKAGLLYKVTDAPEITRPVYAARLTGGERDEQARQAIEVMCRCLNSATARHASGD